MKKWILGVLLTQFVTVPVYAIGIDSMLEYTDMKGEAKFTVTNSDAGRQYINVLISELLVENGNIKKVPYTRDNLNQWAMAAYPARSILEPKFKKEFSLVYQPKKDELVINRDRVFQVSFIPTPYFAEGEKKNNAVKMEFGFAPLVIVPAPQPEPLNYDMEYRGNSVTVVNKGNSFFTLFLDGCPEGTPDKARSTCSVDATVLAGRKLNIPLSAQIAKQSTLKARMSSHGNKFKAEATLRKQQ